MLILAIFKLRSHYITRAAQNKAVDPVKQVLLMYPCIEAIHGIIFW